ncbi:MAG: hypothetical protein AABZ55_06010 [Bdellovibrionota bacterium]
MASTPFDSLPKQKFALRISGPTLGVFLLSYFIVMVVFSPDNTKWNQRRDPSAIIVETDPQASQSPVTKAFDKIFIVPPHCFFGGYDNNFQISQCQKYWKSVGEAAFYALLPLSFAFLFYIAAFDLMRMMYRNARNRISIGEAMMGGVVTHPPLAPTDFMSWAFCLRAIAVERSDKKQMRVYMAIGSQIPSAGDRVAIFYVGQFFGQKRYVAVPYTPHVAVFAGSR